MYSRLSPSRIHQSSLTLVRVPNHLNPQRCALPHPSSHSIHYCVAAQGPVNRSASEKLFADAAREEGVECNEASTEGGTGRWMQPGSKHQNWTGEESMQDAVLRMLVDKHRPLRSGPIRTADQKLKDSPPQVRQCAIAVGPEGNLPARTHESQEPTDAPLLPGIVGHRPWHTTFRAPSHAIASIKSGNFGPYAAGSSTGPDDGAELTRRTERALEKRRQRARRLSHARESTLDYRLGLGDGRNNNGRTLSQTNPITLKGWNTLVEDRIEKARLSGQFDKVKGRGQPIVQQSEEHNPFIAREEFLLNRIVQRNGAAPPWVEIQMDLEAAVNAFRETLRQSWTRRAIRTLAMPRPGASYMALSSSSTVTFLHDREWEERERSYHDAAVAELNSLVRKYNAMAPYAIRRGQYTRDAELARVYQDCRGEILRVADARKPRPETERATREEEEKVGVFARLVRWVCKYRQTNATR